MMNKPETSKSMVSGRDFPMAQAFTVSACECASHYSQHHIDVDVYVYWCVFNWIWEARLLYIRLCEMARKKFIVRSMVA